MKLLFIYNANSGRINGWLDIGHKLISPSTYACDLCSLTHGVFAEREQWKQYRDASSVEMEFLHKDEFEKAYGQQGVDLPAVMQVEEDGGLSLFLSRDEIAQCSDLDQLIERLPSSAV